MRRKHSEWPKMVHSVRNFRNLRLLRSSNRDMDFPEMATRAEGVPAPVAALQAVGVCFPSLGASLGAPLLGASEGQGGSVLPCGGRVALVSGCHRCCASVGPWVAPLRCQ